VLEYTLFFADPGTLITDRGAEPALTSMSAIGSKTVLTPLKWDVCITPESRHRSATLPIAMSSSGNCGATSTLNALTTRLSDGRGAVSKSHSVVSGRAQK
jgi:hypothetical protein